MLLRDAKDVLEAAKLMTEPVGVLRGRRTPSKPGRGRRSRPNVYSLPSAAGPLQGPSILGRGSDPEQGRAVRDDGGARGCSASARDGCSAGRWYGASEMADVHTTGTKFAVFGDFSRYRSLTGSA